MESVFHLPFSLLVLVYLSLCVLSYKCAGVMIWLSRLLTTYTNGLVLITASTSVNIATNTFLWYHLGCSNKTFIESSHPRWEFNNEWPFYSLMTVIITFSQTISALFIFDHIILCNFEMWRVFQDYLIRFTRSCDKALENDKNYSVVMSSTNRDGLQKQSLLLLSLFLSWYTMAQINQVQCW